MKTGSVQVIARSILDASVISRPVLDASVIPRSIVDESVISMPAESVTTGLHFQEEVLTSEMLQVRSEQGKF